MEDVFGVIATHCAPAGVEGVASLSHGIRHAAMPLVRTVRNRCARYDAVVGLLKEHFSPSTRNALEATGLRCAMQSLLCKCGVDVNTILLMQEIGTDPECEVRSIPLTQYTTERGGLLSITVGSIVDAMMHEPVYVFFNGYRYLLRIYSQNDRGQISLPVCKQGSFYSWGYADRIGGVGNFEDAAELAYGATS
jgi:hypothetical protein